MKKILFSVIVPAYNAERHITRALESIRAQTLGDYEVLVTNDGSIDDTAAVLADYARRHPSFPLAVFNQPNGGIGAARNRAMREAQGDWLAFLDADDSWMPEKLERVAWHIIRQPSLDVIYHGGLMIWPDGRASRMRRRQLRQPFYEDLLLGTNPLSPSATVVRKERALSLGGFWERRMATGPDDDMHGSEDLEFWLRLARAGAGFGYFENILEEYHRVENSFSMRINYHGDRSLVVFRTHLQCLSSQGFHSREWIAGQEKRLLAQNKLNRAFLFAQGGDMPRALAAQREALRAARWWWKPYANYLRIARTDPGGVARALGVRTVIGLTFWPLCLVKRCLRSTRLSRANLAPVCLAYHDVPAEAVGQFRRQMVFLKRHYEVIDYTTFVHRLRQPVRCVRPEVLVTLDDGFASGRLAAEAVLAPLGIRAVFFIPTDFVDATTQARRMDVIRNGLFAGRRDVSEDAERFAPMSWQDLATLGRQGHAIGSQTKTHRRLSLLSRDQLRDEIEGSAVVIEQRLGSKVSSFAVPFGSVGSLSAEALSIAAANYETVFTRVSGTNNVACIQSLRREVVDPTDPPVYLGLMIEGGLQWRHRRECKELDKMAADGVCAETRS